MIDIFAEEKPKLYIADVTVSCSSKPRSNSKKIETKTVTLKNTPIVLLNGKFPTKRTEQRFMRRVFDDIGKGKHGSSIMKLVNIENCKYSSELAYKFDFNKH